MAAATGTQNPRPSATGLLFRTAMSSFQRRMLTVSALAVLCTQCLMLHTAARIVHPDEAFPNDAIFTGRSLRDMGVEDENRPDHVHLFPEQGSAQHNKVLSDHNYPTTELRQQHQPLVYNGEDLKSLLEEEVTGIVHIQFSPDVGAVQLPAGEILNPNSAAINCGGGMLDIREVVVVGEIEDKVCSCSSSLLPYTRHCNIRWCSACALPGSMIHRSKGIWQDCSRLDTVQTGSQHHHGLDACSSSFTTVPFFLVIIPGGTKRRQRMPRHNFSSSRS